VVNATTLHYDGERPDVHPTWYGPKTVAVDLAYDPADTPFMQHARGVGASSENGLGMLIHQAVLAFELWTGQRPPVAVFEQAALKAIEARKH
jgi:shikimate dehydrogenase